MSKETDFIIRYFADAGLPGIVTDINSPGVHAVHSCHYWNATHAAPWGLDKSDGSEGCAVDFAFLPPQYDSPRLLAIFSAFDRVAPQLAELFHSGAPHYIRNGQRYPIRQLDRSVYTSHHNHVHVSVHKGTFLQWNGAPVVTAPPEEEVQPYIIVECPTGGYWSLKTDDGGVGAYDGAPFLGSFPGVSHGAHPNAPFVSLTPFVQDNLVKGYWLCGLDGGVFAFGEAPFLGAYSAHPNWHEPGAKVYGLVQTGGFKTGQPITYKQLRREPKAGDYAFQGYEFPLVA